MKHVSYDGKDMSIVLGHLTFHQTYSMDYSGCNLISDYCIYICKCPVLAYSKSPSKPIINAI